MRYILLDRITELSAPDRAVGVKCVSLSDDIFADHFPGLPVMPGSMLLESLAQLGGALLEASMRKLGRDDLYSVLSIVEKAKFRRMVRPGDKVVIEAIAKSVREEGGRVDARATVEGALVCEAALTFSLVPLTNPRVIAQRREVLEIWLSGGLNEAGRDEAEGAGAGGRRRVYVRGVGAFTPLGRTWSESARALSKGASAIRPVTSFDATGFPCGVAASIDLDPSEKAGQEAPGEPKARVDRRLAFAIPAALDAWRAASIAVDPERVGVFMGAESGRTAWDTLLTLVAAAGGKSSFDHAAFGRNARVIAAHIDALVVSPAAVASAVAAAVSALGPVETFSLACASGSAAIAEATRAIRLGQCDAAICGGVGADVDPLMFAAFGLLGALSARGASRPFDARRDGFVVGEGAAIVVLSNESGGAFAEVVGLGRTLDAHHIVAPDPQGDGAARAMRAAIDDARLDGASIDVIQAHGTSTPLNDAVEAAAIRRVLGSGLSNASVSSVKGALGHWIAGAGALGFLCALHSLETGVVFPTAGLEHPDPDCDLPHVIGQSIQKDVHVAMVNSFGFGGANCSLVVRRVE